MVTASKDLVVSALTDVGRQRDANEDAWGMAEELALYVVCDGMGGHASGEVASRLTTEHLIDFYGKHLRHDAGALPYKAKGAIGHHDTLLSNAIQFANDRVYIESMKDPKLEGMGTTVVALVASDDEIVIAHVGDSRVYRWSKNGALEQVTRDHSLLNHKIDRGELRSKEAIANFKQGNVIVRAIGLKDYVEPELNRLPRRPGDVFLLCSDGLTDLVDDWSVENVIAANYDALDEGARCLVRMANARGGKDNITVLLLRIDDQVSSQPSARTTVNHEETTQPTGLKVIEEPATDQELTAEQTSRHPQLRRTAPLPPSSRSVKRQGAQSEQSPNKDLDLHSETQQEPSQEDTRRLPALGEGSPRKSSGSQRPRRLSGAKTAPAGRMKRANTGSEDAPSARDTLPLASAVKDALDASSRKHAAREQSQSAPEEEVDTDPTLPRMDHVAAPIQLKENESPPISPMDQNSAPLVKTTTTRKKTRKRVAKAVEELPSIIIDESLLD